VVAETTPETAIRLLGRPRAQPGSARAVESDLAEAQHGVASRRQLLAAGLRPGAIQRRIDAGRLHPLHRGVYAVGHRVLSRQGRMTAALLASDPGAVLSHRSAAALWGLRDQAGAAVELTIPRKSSSSPVIRRHRADLAPDEITVCDRIPVTTVPRTILDLAASSSIDALEAILREAEYRRLFDRLSIPELLSRHPGRRGSRRLRVCLERIAEAPAGRAESPLESRFLSFLRGHGLPRPQLNAWVSVASARYRVDCLWPGSRQIAELDGWAGHGTRSAFQDDRARDRALAAAGYAVTRITWSQLEREPRQLAADLRILLETDGPDGRSLTKPSRSPNTGV
jgi:very-short-patch-repair endonuclease